MKKIIYILLMTACLVISCLSCKNHQGNLEKGSSVERFEQLPDSMLIQPDSLGKTHLHHAALKGDTALISYLLKRGLDLEQKDNSGFTPLHDAVQRQDTSAIRFLIKHGADVHARTVDLNTPLHLAVFNSDIGKVVLFKQRFSF